MFVQRKSQVLCQGVHHTMITGGGDFHLPYFHNNPVSFQKLCGRVKKDYTEWTQFQPNTINLHICCKHSQILPLPGVGLLVVSFQMCCPWVSCWSEEVLNIWPQCISDLITDFFTLKPHCTHQVIKIAPTLWKAITYKYLIIGMHFQSFSDWFRSTILPNCVGFTEPGHPSKQLQWPPPATRHQ